MIFPERARYQIGMRALFLCLAFLTLAGCNSLMHVSGDNFEATGVDPGLFGSDNQACRIQADDFLAYDVHGMDGTRYQRNRTYNGVYRRCMTARGYRDRPYYRNWLPG